MELAGESVSKILSEDQFEKVKEILDWVTRIDEVEMKFSHRTKDVTTTGHNKHEQDYSREAEELLLKFNYI